MELTSSFRMDTNMTNDMVHKNDDCDMVYEACLCPLLVQRLKRGCAKGIPLDYGETIPKHVSSRDLTVRY